MRRASQKRPVSVCATPESVPAGLANGVAISDSSVGDDFLPGSAAIAKARSEVSSDCEARHRAREVAIQQRIESRLPGRVRNLLVRSFDAVVILEGQCATYYTKQLAQHTAMGVLEDEHLENAIVVHVEQ